MTFSDLLKKFRAGTIEESDLEGVTAEDWMKVRLEAGDGHLHVGLSTDAIQAHQYSFAEGVNLASKDDESKRKSYGYVMVSDALIPPLSDRVLSNAWDVREFKYRGSNLLYDHNWDDSKPPIGKVENVKKGVEMKRGGNAFKALTGDVSFAPGDAYPFAGMIESLVDGGFLTNGSVGFDVVKMRAATEEEQEEQGMKPYSAVIQKANLIEFSITPLGRDKNAQKLSAQNVDAIEGRLAEFAAAGVYDDSVIGELRESLAAAVGAATRTVVPMPSLSSSDEAPVAVVNITVDPVSLEAVKSYSATIGSTLGDLPCGYPGEILPGPIIQETNLGIPNSPLPIPPVPQGFTFGTIAEHKLRDEVSDLRDEVAALRAELAGLRDEMSAPEPSVPEPSAPEPTLYDLLFDEPVGEETPDGDESRNGDDSSPDLYDLAVEAGLVP